MSRIQQVLQKAQQDGVARRTRDVEEHPAARMAAMPVLVAPDDTRPLRVDLVNTPPLTPAEPLAGRTIQTAPQPHPLLVAVTAPHSPAAERYRSLRTRIAQTENGSPRRALMLTSPGRGEGKSMTSVNLGLTMAQEFHRRVIVVDTDMRRPCVHALLGLPLSPGLSDVLLGGATLQDVMVTIPDYRLTIVPAGLPPEQPTELLGSTAMRRVLEELRSQFDRILLDAPPVGPLADVGVVGRLVDSVLLVVRAGRTPRPAIERALVEIAPSVVLGLVLNDAGGPEAGAYGFDSDGHGYAAAARRPRTTAPAIDPAPR
jgi:capsular exopolysaccharide synthesis family protein